jgi:hypothetical protein
MIEGGRFGRAIVGNLATAVITVALACGGSSAPPEDGPPLRVITVDEDGNPVASRRVLWQPQPADAFWLEATAARCEAGEPPCTTWVLDAPITAAIAVTAERVTEATPTESCQPYASTFAIVHPGDDDVPRQVLHLTLPSDGTYCIDAESGRAVINVEHAEDVSDDVDTLAAPAPPAGPIVLRLRDPEGAPVPGINANWYYSPEGPEYDGEHPLRCADLQCSTWVLVDGDAPRAGMVYFSASYSGPLNPFIAQGWFGYDGRAFELAADGEGLAAAELELELATDQEGATGG